MKKLFFEKGYTGTKKDTIIQITGFLVLAATFLPCLIVYIALRNDIAILIFFIVLSVDKRFYSIIVGAAGTDKVLQVGVRI